MTQSSLFGVLLFSMVGTALSSRMYWRETQRSCDDAVCGVRTCVVKTRLCWQIPFLEDKPTCLTIGERPHKDCEQFRCENNGTLSRQSAKRYKDRAVYSCDWPPPVCACPPGFTGRCCETQVKDGKCPKLPEIARHPCVQECNNDFDCKGSRKCCERYCSKVCVDVKNEDPCARVDCGPGKDCKNVAFPCLIPPCPQSFKCVRGGEKPGVCPIFPNTFTTCESKFDCEGDRQCSGDKICCKRGCSKECVDPLPERTTGCDRVVCLPGTVCRKMDSVCRFGKRCRKQFECVAEASSGYNNKAVISSTFSNETERPTLYSDDTLQLEMDGNQ